MVDHGKKVQVDDLKEEFEEYNGPEIFWKLEIPKVKIMSSSLPVLPIYYFVDGWVTSRISAARVLQTPLRFLGMPDSSCEDSYFFQIPIDQHLYTTSLNLEVIRFGSIGETGTSTGQILVGKAQIKLPKVFKEPIIGGVFNLLKNVGTECSLQGQIEVNLQVVKFIRKISSLPPSVGWTMVSIDVQQHNNNRRSKRRRDPRNLQLHHRSNQSLVNF
ncbi:hypothetical protein NE237_030300 [Protea cynaroides]|uniref:Uncharacterized protein n=1 Tax=Protea cynaroides TaxID=273540 RepID=A0A9Q0GVP6_9MAGN|nr:hypothetical protein NE237_030300 [Protea cynaroides]